MKRLRNLPKDVTGAALAEFAIVFVIFLLVIGGAIDFSLAFYQWNQMAKAVERGARIAAVSSPVASGLQTLNSPAGCATAGDAWPPGGGTYDIICKAGSCSGTGAAGYDATAMNAILYGRGNSAAKANATGPYSIGMWNIFPQMNTANVVVEYKDTGLGFCGRPGGPIPTIEVSLQNVQYNWFFLGSLLQLVGGAVWGNTLTLPTVKASITGEDLCSAPYATDANGNPVCNAL